MMWSISLAIVRCMLILSFLISGVPLSYATTLPTLPTASVNTTLPTVNGTTYAATCATFQTQLNAAAAANVNLTHEIILPVATCTGRFDMPSHNGGTGWILIKGVNYASLPASGTRVTTSDATLMPTLQHGTLAGSSSGTIQAVTGAQRYRFIGIHFVQNSAQSDNNNWISFGWGNNLATNTGYFILDRVVIEDTSTTHSSGRAVLADSDLGNIAMIDSYCGGIKKSGAETQCFQYDISAGPTLVQNNFLEACGEVMMVGGGTSKDAARHPSDITVKLNSFSVPSYCWGQGTGGFVVKSLLELKTGKRVLIEANDFFNMPENDGGYAHRFTSRNPFGGDTWATITDLTVQYNLYKNINNWLQMYTTDIAGAGGSNGSTVHGQRWALINNLVWGLDFRHISQTGRMIGILAANGASVLGCTDPTPDGCGLKDFTFRHNTVDDINNNLFCNIDSTHINMDFKDNLINNNNGRGYYNCNVSGGIGTALLTTQWGATYSWIGNTIAVGSVGGGFGGENASNYPQGTNSYPSSAASFLWTSQVLRDYTLQATSPAKNSASDGTDRGVNFTLYNAARSGGSVPDTTPPAAPTGITVQ